jgi:hypothetical protein
LFGIAMAFRAYRDPKWDSFARSSFYTLMFYLLVTIPWFQNWYSLWPLGLAVVLPPGRAARLGFIFAIATLSKPFIFGPIFLWPIPTPPEPWRELRLGPAVMAVPLVYALWGIANEAHRHLGNTWRLLTAARQTRATVSSGRTTGERDCVACDE